MVPSRTPPPEGVAAGALSSTLPPEAVWQPACLVVRCPGPPPEGAIRACLTRTRASREEPLGRS